MGKRPKKPDFSARDLFVFPFARVLYGVPSFSHSLLTHCVVSELQRSESEAKAGDVVNFSFVHFSLSSAEKQNGHTHVIGCQTTKIKIKIKSLIAAAHRRSQCSLSLYLSCAFRWHLVLPRTCIMCSSISDNSPNGRNPRSLPPPSAGSRET